MKRRQRTRFRKTRCNEPLTPPHDARPPRKLGTRRIACHPFTGERRADDEAERGDRRPKIIEEHPHQHRDDHADHGDGGVLALEVGLRAFLDGGGDFLHLGGAGRRAEHLAAGDEAVDHCKQAQADGNQCQVHNETNSPSPKRKRGPIEAPGPRGRAMAKARRRAAQPPRLRNSGRGAASVLEAEPVPVGDRLAVEEQRHEPARLDRADAGSGYGRFDVRG